MFLSSLRGAAAPAVTRFTSMPASRFTSSKRFSSSEVATREKAEQFSQEILKAMEDANHENEAYNRGYKKGYDDAYNKRQVINKEHEAECRKGGFWNGMFWGYLLGDTHSAKSDSSSQSTSSSSSWNTNDSSSQSTSSSSSQSTSSSSSQSTSSSSSWWSTDDSSEDAGDFGD